MNGATLFTNKEKETWMDTSYEDDGRKGVRIEIQALFYSLYEAINLLGKLTDSKDVFQYHKEQSEFKKAIRMTFLQDDFPGLLIDGKNDGHIDKTYRPNVFLAAYVARGLLSTKEWKVVIDAHLKKLYLPWGGIASIDKDDSRFQSSYTGQNNKSYHRGDSWYFINHIAAKVMFELDDEHYKTEIAAIIYASTKDILEEGFAGHASEISSASVQEAHASLAQAWSSATFIELVDTLYPSDD
jgi:glycogen debranching enzyme